MSLHERRTAKDVLSGPITFPNELAESKLLRLVGLDKHIESLVRDLRLVFDPGLLGEWSRRHYREILPVLELVGDAVPLFVLEGDVGTGKTALAETIGQRVATIGRYGVHMVKMSTRVRGTGYVGEMGTLLADSFDHVLSLYQRKGEPVLFVIDEADSVLTSRSSEEHHHEDKSGVNTILQELDKLRDGGAQIAVLSITNRVGVLDPAVVRRATSVLRFHRPDRDLRAVLLASLFGNALAAPDIERLVEASDRSASRNGKNNVPLSYSDLTLTFAVPSIRRAVGCDEKLDPRRLVETLRNLVASPTMENNC